MAGNPAEQRIREEVVHLVKNLRALNGGPTDVSQLIMNAVSNVTCHMLFGKRYDYEDKNFRNLLQSCHRMMTGLQSSAMLTYIPILWYSPMPFKNELRHHYQKVIDYTKRVVEECRLAESDEFLPTSFVDAYLEWERDHENTKCEGVENSKRFLGEPEHLSVTVLNLFTTGTTITATSIVWTLLFLCQNQDVQERCFNEIKDNIGLEVAPAYHDMRRLPYIEAVTMEVHRRASLMPLGLPHAVSDDVEVYGYTIPKGTMVMSNLWAVHMDEKNWERPEKFDPSRFLDDNGPRDCIASQFAEMEFFLMLSRLVQVFKFKLPDDDLVPSADGNPGLINAPDNFKIICASRFSDDF
ncbi:cytochrome P450 2U1-like [Ptychodera flava]|uniref:cytochrome P450 2U1-like n=1 Tax=Ptychodera flava TaxID=63121 RepID=UPI00396A8ECE